MAIRRSSNGKQHLVTFKPTINPSFNPLIILDASGRKGYRKIYDEMVKRDRIIRLDHEDKLYEGFEIDVWNTGGGKDAFKREWDALVSGIARWINKLPDGDRCLVIHHRPDPLEDIASWKARFKTPFYMRNFEESLKEFLAIEYPFFDQDRLGFTTWGKHRARNTWADYEAVVAAGTLFKPDAVYEAQYRIAKGYFPKSGLVAMSTLRDFRLGEDLR